VQDETDLLEALNFNVSLRHYSRHYQDLHSAANDTFIVLHAPDYSHFVSLTQNCVCNATDMTDDNKKSEMYMEEEKKEKKKGM
jgi:hypothetical protein